MQSSLLGEERRILIRLLRHYERDSEARHLGFVHLFDGATLHGIQRTRELGIPLSLAAKRSHLLQITALGICLGLGGAVLLVRFITKLPNASVGHGRLR